MSISPLYDPGDDLRAVEILREALVLYRRQFVRVAGGAVATLVPIALAETALERWIEHAHSAHDLSMAAFVEASAAVVGGLFVFAELFYVGFLEKSVGADIEGEPLPSIREVLRRLPLGRLFVADGIATALTAIASLAFVLPGLIVFTLFGIVGPVINIEDRRVLDGLGRSATLVASHFLLTFALILVPATAEQGVGFWFSTFAVETSWGAVVLVSVILGVTLGASVGLIQVVLAHALIRRDRAGAEAPDPFSPSSGGGRRCSRAGRRR